MFRTPHKRLLALPAKISPPLRATHTSSVNHEEVTHFNALASDWWDPHGSSRLLHLMNPWRHTFIRQCLIHQDPATKLRFLDVGCGGGIFAESAARLPQTESVIAVDPTPEVITVAKKHQTMDPLLMEPGRLTYLNSTVEELKHASPRFDIVTLFEVIEHIQRPSPFLETCLRHVKPGGWLIGSTISRHPLSWFTTKFVAEDVLRLVPKGMHTWEQYIRPEELRAWAASQLELDAWHCMGVVYIPGLGWKEVKGSADYGNYFFGMRKSLASVQEDVIETT
ncbi:ubiquinone biosynthesis O-methyltransferase [Piedraia hortae CBS 480.64]|uniref:Ubiquinone biosynthesis O-methyltransferase, mitochondrial n=1 Tax=Piedraia hortae CBS 480.64 TaxID=1314780 RepID=A0A6A7BQW6_9PEZI|nr:ubiquinone biosynthesis O-methyltransferase [Piedraia hortae CBS 480.64]